ncbi:MAG: hypothetical protein WCB59_15315 [Candidatus Sulfotelmatobacter sp.]
MQDLPYHAAEPMGDSLDCGLVAQAEAADAGTLPRIIIMRPENILH